ncbi:penicillin amidase [Desulfosalsimonas propionicica]|uniref:Penicillin amidase n=1 Tax=Desulfosalsimonas propionicica TaxID=332175 RepID=A0A7W0HLU4_9BACT|nr:penicillin acylase family protein [Desulfosalsimonas propionicica]MBA2882692.1 penicillin amidase [Desulfosalsimonas propionicica]
MKILKGGIFILLLLVVGGFVSFQIFFRSAIPDYSGSLKVSGLSSPVEVKTDEYGVPHIIAENEADLFFAQGYITARERLFQMDTTRLAGRGELSTLFGEATLDKDRFLKTVGFYRMAEKSWKAMSKETRGAVEAYTAGINAYIENMASLPREYIFIGARPKPWEPEDCVTTVLLMSYSLTRSKRIDLAMHQLGRKAGLEVLSALLPQYPDFAPTLTGQDLAPPKQDTDEAMRELSANTAGVGGGLFSGLPEFAASNWMIFSGSMTDSGKPIFTGSPDLKPTLPALFYLVHLKGGRYDVIGGSLPGAPGISALGFNGDIAWSAVNGRGDELDYFVEKIHPDDTGKYLTENGYKDFRIIWETLRIKTDKGIREEPLEVKISRHGPVISGVMPAAPENCAMQWSAFDVVSRDIEGLLAMNRAKNFSEFRKSLKLVKTVNLGIGYADSRGNIGWQFTASVPIRKKGQGSVPVPGWTGEYDWTGYVPYKRLPWDYNPENGCVASFNNEPGNSKDFLTHYYLFERAIRFRDIMDQRSGEKVSLEDARQMQLDTVSPVARRWVPHILEACTAPDLQKAADLFRSWDFRIVRNSAAATLFNAFYSKMMENTLADETGQETWDAHLRLSYLYYVPDLLLTKIHDAGTHAFYDDAGTPDKKESRNDIIQKSMRDAMEQLSARLGENPQKWQWKRVHTMHFEHPLGSKIWFLNLDPIPTDGSHHTINSGFWDNRRPFRMDSGGVIRMVVDFADIENSTMISPPGQSGHYMSPHFDDTAQMWADGKQIPMHFNSYENLPRQMVLEPAVNK